MWLGFTISVSLVLLYDEHPRPRPPFCTLPAVIQDVDNSSLEGNYQSFASLMEQRLAEVFVIARQQGRRFRRATTVGSYTVQVGRSTEGGGGASQCPCH